MQRYLAKLIFTICLLSPIVCLAAKANNAPIKAGIDYQIIKAQQPVNNSISKNKVQVIEFFSYGCPWCFHLESSLEAWLAHKPKNVVFKRIPVVFEPGWQTYAKAYYTAEALGVATKLTPAIFNAIHKQNLDLSSEQAMKKFFVSHGVNKTKFDSAFNFSPGIGMEMSRGNQLMQTWKVYEIPTFVIDGKYKTNTRMTKGNNKRLLQVVKYLVAKASKQRG